MYCAGLWRSALAMELFWILDDDQKLAPRPRAYQGPSWSWATINGLVTSIPQEPSDSIDSQFSVVGVHIPPVKSALGEYDSRFGAVESGRLVLTGKVKAALWMHPQNPAKSPQWKVLRRPNYPNSDSYLRIKVWLDAIEA